MPIKRGHVAPQNTYIVTLIRSFDQQCHNFLAANAMFVTKPVVYCSEGLCDLLGYTKAQLMLKSSALKVLYGQETSQDSIESLSNSLSETKETEVSICFYTKNGSAIHCKISVTPVRDETGQLPLYLLFFHRENVDDTVQNTFNKRYSMRTRLQLKSFLLTRNTADAHKRVRHSDSGRSTLTSPSPSSKVEADKVGLPDCKNTSSVADIRSRHPENPEAVSDNSNHEAAATVFGEKEATCPSDKSTSGRYKQARPLSLLLASNHESDRSSPHFLTVPSSKLAIDREPAPQISPVRRRPATWYRDRIASEDNLEPMLPQISRVRSGIPTNLADSEALRLVLSGHPEPTKASVTEKFAQFLSLDEDLHVEHRFQSPHVHKFTLKHYSMFKAVWDWIILVLIIYTAIATPFVTVFLTNHGNKYAKLISFRNSSSSSDSGLNSSASDTESTESFSLLRTVEILVDIMFFVDIFINFRTTYVNKNDEVVSHPRRIATHYVKGWFFIDLVAAIPFDLIFFQSSGDQHTTLTSLLKSARLLRLVGIMRKLDRYSEYGASILLLLTALFALIAHWLACIWYAIGNAEHQYREPKIGWLNTLAQQTEQHYTDDPQSGPNLPTKYITALYFTFSSLTSIGFGNVSPNTNAEKVFSIIVMLVGSLMYASIFGNVGALIQRLYSGTARYHAQMLRIKEFIRFHQIPSPLRQRLEEYSTQVWEHTNGIDMTMVQYSFPESLQSDICLYVYRDFLGGSPAFKSLSDGCLRNISLRIRATHMPPSDTLIHTGDLLTSVYYVVKGSLEVVTTDDLILGVLNPGDFFGGLPTLVVQYTSTGLVHCPHDFPGDSCLHSPTTYLPPVGSPPSIAAIATAPPPKSRFAVRALTYADVQFIDRHDLTDLCHVYPELSARLLERFELTIPLVSGSNLNTQPPRSASVWFNCKSNLDAFLASSATWNPVSPDVLRSLVPLVSRRSTRADRTKECLNPNKPTWELERLQRLFDHGALCMASTDDPPVSVTPKNPSQTNFHLNSVDRTRSSTGLNPLLTPNTVNTVSSSNNNSRIPPSTKNPQQSPKERRLRRLFARSRSPASEVLTHPASEVFTHPTSLPTSVENCFSADECITVNHDLAFVSDADPQTVRCLLARFARVEKQIQQLDARISTTIDQILTHLRGGVLTPSVDS